MFLESVALEIRGNKKVKHVNLSNLKFINSSGPIKVKLDGIDPLLTPDEMEKFLNQTGLDKNEVEMIYVTTTTSTIQQQLPKLMKIQLLKKPVLNLRLSPLLGAN